MKKLFIIAGVSIIGFGVVKAQQAKVNTLNHGQQEVQRKAIQERGDNSKELSPELKTQIMKDEFNLNDQQVKAMSTILEEKESMNARGNRAVQQRLNEERKAVLSPEQIRVAEQKAEAKRMESISSSHLERTPSKSEDRSERHRMLKKRN